jgi:hypothetical protein
MSWRDEPTQVLQDIGLRSHLRGMSPLTALGQGFRSQPRYS